MAVSDKVLGAVLIALAGFIFVYYSVWVLILVRRGACLLFRTLRWNKPAQPLSRPACPPPLHPRFPAVCRRFRHLGPLSTAAVRHRHPGVAVGCRDIHRGHVHRLRPLEGREEKQKVMVVAVSSFYVFFSPFFKIYCL